MITAFIEHQFLQMMGNALATPPLTPPISIEGREHTGPEKKHHEGLQAVCTPLHSLLPTPGLRLQGL